jgi:hypothetical protein
MNDDFKDDELIDIRLPRKEYNTLKTMIEREETYTRITGSLKSSWIWVVGGGALTILLLWDKLHGVIK